MQLNLIKLHLYSFLFSNESAFIDVLNADLQRNGTNISSAYQELDHKDLYLSRAFMFPAMFRIFDKPKILITPWTQALSDLYDFIFPSKESQPCIPL
jgi:hypothetical protein